MLLPLTARILATTDSKALWKFAWNFGVKGMRSVHLFKSRLERGEFFPPFLYLSILNSCNLRCQGCWVDVDKPRVSLSLEDLNRIINQAKAHGNSFFGILGGEPFMHPQLLDLLAQHPDCYFQIFTNGQLITDKIAARLRQLGNATPLVSIEGDEVISDERRGNKDVYKRTLRGLQNCLRHRLLTGVATSVCQSNIETLVSEQWLRRLIAMGVHYAWYHTYRVVGPNMSSELALVPEQVKRVRRFVVDMRVKLPIGLIDAYYDGEGEALCPMATGISHHISPNGAIEPCPIIQFATANVRDGDIFELLSGSEFMRDFRETAARHTRGCIVLERPDLVNDLVHKHGARDTTIRQTALAEVRQMRPRPSQYLKDVDPIPEKHWLYRLGKRFFYNDFGAYDRVNGDESVKA
ncbi:MAG: radical SAM/SPASM domain-containing protein [Verrucomicrobiales bacterium]